VFHLQKEKINPIVVRMVRDPISAATGCGARVAFILIAACGLNMAIHHPVMGAGESHDRGHRKFAKSTKEESMKLDVKMDLEAWKKAYQNSDSVEKKREIALKVIDRGIVSRGVPISRVNEIFGVDFDARTMLNEDGSGRGIVNFSPPLKSGRDDVASGYEGWYWVIDYDSEKRITNYYLSNLHK
jgi:hypothetical protein